MPPTPRADESTAGLHAPASEPQVWVQQLRLTNFRNYRELALRTTRRPVVLTGPNGSGKTNLLEAISLLAPGQGLRRVAFPELARLGSTDWAVAATVETPRGPVSIGTGLRSDNTTRSGRIVRINGADQTGSGSLAGLLDVFWLTPAMDGLFTGPTSERRRFLDHLIPSFDPGYRPQLGQFERAMQQRNRLLADDVREPAQFSGLERIMAEAGVAIAAARAAAVAELRAAIEVRRDAAVGSAFPWATLALDGTLETALATRPAVDVEDGYADSLGEMRERDRAAARTLEGPHRSDLVVGHGPKRMPAGACSTGEQKSLLIGLVLAHADLIRRRREGAAPILLLDEVAAHLDPLRRAALFDELVALDGQAWLTGTEAEAFAGLDGRAQFCRVEDGLIALSA